jgi:hypothetical protein
MSFGPQHPRHSLRFLKLPLRELTSLERPTQVGFQGLDSGE